MYNSRYRGRDVNVRKNVSGALDPVVYCVIWSRIAGRRMMEPVDLESSRT
jgi:hypothetical protein